MQRKKVRGDQSSKHVMSLTLAYTMPWYWLQHVHKTALIKAYMHVTAGDSACCAHVFEAKQAACNRW